MTSGKLPKGLSAPKTLDRCYANAPCVLHVHGCGEGWPLLFVSANAPARVGIAAEEFCDGSRDWLQRVHADDLPGLKKAFAALAGAPHQSLSYCLCSGTEGPRQVRDELHLVCDEQGRPSHIEGYWSVVDTGAGLVSDIADHKELERRLNLSEARFRHLIDATEALVVSLDPEGRVTFLNDAAEKATGYCLEEIRGRNWFETVTPRGRYPEVWAEFQRLMAGGLPHVFENPIITKSGEERYIVWQNNERFEGDRIAGTDSFGIDITSRRMVEEALRKSEERFRIIADHTYNWENWIDPDGRLIWLNPSVKRITGYTAEECYAMADFPASLIHPDDLATTLEGYRRAVAGENGSDIEFRIRRKDGREAWGSVSHQAVYGDDGRFIGHRSSIRDITQQKKTLEALFEARQMLQLVLDHIPQRVFWKDRRSVYLGANRAFLADVGLPNLEALCGRRDADLATSTHADLYVSDDNLVMSQDRPKLDYEEPIVLPGGERRWLRTNKTPIHDSRGNVIGLLGTYTDVTGEKAIQHRLHDTLDQLRTILDTAQVGIGHLVDRRFVWINPAMEHMFGYKLAELDSRTTEVMYPSREAYEELDRTAHRRLSAGKNYETERLMRRRSGELFWVHLRGIAIDPAHPERGSIWILLDIDKQKRAQENLEALNRSLRERVEQETAKSLQKERLMIEQARHAAMGEMIGNIAHQWRQPLSVLGLILQNLHYDFSDGRLDAATMAEYHKKALRAVQQMTTTIDDFRDFFRPSRKAERFSPVVATSTCIELVGASLKSHNIAITLRGPSQLELLGYESEFSQVILNLITNAKDALLEHKPPRPQIAITVTANDTSFIITERNNGGTIPPANLEKIFDPYFTTKAKGTGIGLYMVKTIVEQHMHGSIRAANVEDGVEFIVTLPFRNNEN